MHNLICDRNNFLVYLPIKLYSWPCEKKGLTFLAKFKATYSDKETKVRENIPKELDSRY